jgi:hypothetical protein
MIAEFKVSDVIITATRSSRASLDWRLSRDCGEFRKGQRGAYWAPDHLTPLNLTFASQTPELKTLGWTYGFLTVEPVVLNTARIATRPPVYSDILRRNVHEAAEISADDVTGIVNAPIRRRDDPGLSAPVARRQDRERRSGGRDDMETNCRGDSGAATTSRTRDGESLHLTPGNRCPECVRPLELGTRRALTTRFLRRPFLRCTGAYFHCGESKARALNRPVRA